MKRKQEREERQLLLFASMRKRLRSKLPRRRRRLEISPVLRSFFTTGAGDPSRLVTDDLSFECDSYRASVNYNRRFDENVCDKFRRATRDRNKDEKRGFVDAGEMSETSCVESCSEAVSGKRNENSLKFRNCEVISEPKRGVERASDSEALNKSEISAVTSIARGNSRLEGEKTLVTQNSIEINSTDVVSIHSVLQSASDSNFGRTSDKYMCKSQNRDEEEVESGAESGEENARIDFDITCSENFTDEVACESWAYSELESELYAESSEFDFSDYTPSIWYESGSQFSEKSINDESPPTFQLSLQFSQEFCKSTFALATDREDSSHINDYPEITLLGLEEKEDEEAYKMISIRERRRVYLRDYAEEYCSSTKYGDLILQQRRQMVHWIIEQAANKEFQQETLFLSVSLLDRFLSKGYFQTERNLQIAGIACLTLATRFEENQPLNSVQQNIFHIGDNTYSRYEVVAMEWLVQDVLKFRCFLPTLYNFLWFYLRAAKASEKVEKSVKYLAIVALLGHEQLCFWPSTVAAVLVILASKEAKQEAFCYNIRQTHARMEEDRLPECLKKLSYLAKHIN